MPSFTATAAVAKMNSDGSVVVNMALTEMGQGCATAVGQIAAETLLRDWPKNVAPLIRRWVGHAEQYGRVG